MYCHVVGSKRLRGERIEHMKEWARRGLQYHPKGSWRVWRGPAGDWIVKHPRTCVGSEMDQKQLDMSSLVNKSGEGKRARARFSQVKGGRSGEKGVEAGVILP